MEKPKTLKEMVEQLWYAHYGNGLGMNSRLSNIEKSFNGFKDNREKTCPIRRQNDFSFKLKSLFYPLIIGVIASIPGWIALFGG